MAKKKPEKQAGDAREQLETAAAGRRQEKYILTLYVSGATPRSTRAIENIRSLCEKHLEGRYELEVVDIYQNPDRARSEQIIAAPTLIRKLPLPLRRFLGDLSDAERILVGLDVKEEAEEDQEES